MTSEPAEAAPPSWLDHWLEPPWRALLTWIVLAAVMSFADMHGGTAFVDRLSTFAMNKSGWVFAGRLSPYFDNLAFNSNTIVLLLWYQPFVLRLHFIRWGIWMGVAAVWAAVVGVRIYYWSSIGIDELHLTIWFWPMLAGSLLVGCRTRPWMSLPAGALSMVAGIWLQSFAPSAFPPYPWWWPGFTTWWWLPASSIPYAVVMLYGTRRLPRAQEIAPAP